MEEQYISKLHPAVDYGAGVFLLIVAILTVLGNAAVLATAVRRSSLLKAPELLTVNLAVADLGMALSMYPLAIASAWSHAWLGGHPSCVYYALMGFLFGVCSMMTLCAMAVVRFLVTRSSKSNCNKITKNTVCILIAFIWLYSLLWAILPLVGWGYYGPEPFGISCTIAWSKFHNSSNGFSFILSMFLLCTVLPALTIVACYLGIAWKVHKAYQEIQNIDRIPNAAKLERKLTLMAVLISVAFLSSWTPYAAASFWSIFNSSASLQPVVTLLPCLFAKSSTAYNPLIYYVFSRTFRGEVRKLQRCCAWRGHSFSSDASAGNAVPGVWSGRDNVRLSAGNAVPGVWSGRDNVRLSAGNAVSMWSGRDNVRLSAGNAVPGVWSGRDNVRLSAGNAVSMWSGRDNVRLSAGNAVSMWSGRDSVRLSAAKGGSPAAAAP